LLIGIVYEKRRGDASSKSNWDAAVFLVQIHGVNIRKIGGREMACFSYYLHSITSDTKFL